MRLLLLLAVLLATAAVHAQPAVPTGTQVRIQGPQGRLVGVALAVGSDTLVVADAVAGHPTAVAYGDMESLEVRRTRSRARDTKRAALIGASIGAVPVVAMIVYGQFAPSESMWLLGVFYVAPAIPIGAGIGAALGALGPTDWWERVPTGWISPGPFVLRPTAFGTDGGGVSLAVRL